MVETVCIPVFKSAMAGSTINFSIVLKLFLVNINMALFTASCQICKLLYYLIFIFFFVLFIFKINFIFIIIIKNLIFITNISFFCNC